MTDIIVKVALTEDECEDIIKRWNAEDREALAVTVKLEPSELERVQKLLGRSLTDESKSD